MGTGSVSSASTCRIEGSQVMPGDESELSKDAASNAEEWSLRAKELITAEPDADPSWHLSEMKRRLDAIREGQRIRRRLDLIMPESGSRSDQARDLLVNGLTRLRQEVDQRDLIDLGPDASRADELTRRLQADLNEVRLSLRGTMANSRGDALGQSLVLEGLRGDVEWMGRIVARIDKEEPTRRVALIEVELERLEGLLDVDNEDQSDPETRLLLDRCVRLQNNLLERRVDRELSRPIADPSASPADYWVRRFQLSKLQAQVQSLDLAAQERDDSPDFQEKRDRWIQGISALRDALIDQSDAEISGLPRPARLEAREQVIRTANDEVNETVAFLEDLPLPRAVCRLELVREDLERLSRSCSSWFEEESRTKETEVEEKPEIDLDGKEDEELPQSIAVEIEATPVLLRDRESLRQRLRRQQSRVQRLIRQVKREWQEKLLGYRMETLLGARFASGLEHTVMALIVILSGLIITQLVFESIRPLTPLQKAIFAWSDLVICSVFLFEFFLKLSLAPRKLSYFLRHFVIDLVVSIPFGFLIYQADQLLALEGTGHSRIALFLAGLLRYGRFAQLLRYIRVAMPAVRLLRVALFALRLSDRLVRRLAGLLNRNIILFEPTQAQRPESRFHYRLTALRAELDHANTVLEAKLDPRQRKVLGARLTADLESVLHGLSSRSIEEGADDVERREIPVEAVVERLIQMTPERLIDRMGPAFVISVDRYIRIFDVPFIRRFPVIRNLVSHREKSHAEAVALAVNYFGHLIQRGLDIIYFLADLQGTVSPTVFLDRLGATIVNATSKPAKRLLWLGFATSALYLVVQVVPGLSRFRPIIGKLQDLLGWPVIILGLICLGLWSLGAWFRKIANQSSDFCERVVEAQFATQTKSLKAKRQEHDAKFLSERVIDPELILRSSDDDLSRGTSHKGDEREATEAGSQGSAQVGDALFPYRELAFLRTLRLLYQDYLDGSPLHRSDNKASVQLLGNLALANMRRSHLGHLLKESRALDRLDLSRAGGLFGGAFLWFNYVTRMIVQDTAILLLDYNRHAIPIDRLMCSPEKVRQKFRAWLARRLKVDEELIELPDRVVEDSEEALRERHTGNGKEPAAPGNETKRAKRRREARMFFETVEFTAIDFLSDEPERDAEIRKRFGSQVADLVRLDRQQNVRRAFRSFPLHELPLAQRTFNLFTLYENNLASGRLVLLPFRLAKIGGKVAYLAARNLTRLIREILDPNVNIDREVPSDTYWAALRKIHRMRKPVFMGTLWLRARFDVEYLGLPLPTAPAGIASQSLLENDLDVIGATRRDRIIVERIRQGHQRRLEAISRWINRFGWTFNELPHRLAQDIPFLTDRGGEALRAIVAACTLDHDDIATLGLAIEGLTRMMEHAADATHDPDALPPGLPEPVTNTRLLWYPVNRCRRSASELFELPCFPKFNRLQQRRILYYLRRHRRVARGWIKVVLGQGGSDPWDTVKARLRKVLVRTDLWSDQIIVLRAVQTLTMLDLQHNCELVWNLGGYQQIDPNDEGLAPLHAPTGAAEAERVTFTSWSFN